MLNRAHQGYVLATKVLYFFAAVKDFWERPALKADKARAGAYFVDFVDLVNIVYTPNFCFIGPMKTNPPPEPKTLSYRADDELRARLTAFVKADGGTLSSFSREAAELMLDLLEAHAREIEALGQGLGYASRSERRRKGILYLVEEGLVARKKAKKPT